MFRNFREFSSQKKNRMDYFRQCIFMAKGMSEFTRSAFESASAQFVSHNPIDMTNTSVLITGANSGIGFETAKALASKGARIHMLCRDQKKGDSAFIEILERSRTGCTPTLNIADLSKPEQIFLFCKKFTSEHNSLDILINNAGCMVPRWELSAIGKLETNFCTNTFAPYVLTMKLLPLLKKSADPRVITVSSGGMYTEKLHIDDFNWEKSGSFNTTKAYAQNKRQQVVMMEKFATSEPSVFIATMHPGWADTPAVKTSMPSFYRHFQRFLRSAEQGADTLIWLASNSDRSRLTSGAFYFDRKAVNKHLSLAKTQSNPGDEDKLMSKLDVIMVELESKLKK